MNENVAVLYTLAAYNRENLIIKSLRPIQLDEQFCICTSLDNEGKNRQKIKQFKDTGKYVFVSKSILYFMNMINTHYRPQYLLEPN